jgi:hypothetical protein
MEVFMKTTSLELSKQLKEAGFPQETYFYHKTAPDNYYALITNNYDDGYPIRKEGKIGRRAHGANLYAAPTAEEILERLPAQIDELGFLSIRKFMTYWVGYGEGTKKYAHKDNEILAEAAGEMYLYLNENHLLKEDSIEAKKEV